MVVEDRDALVQRIGHFPVGRLHDLARRAHRNGHSFRSKTQRRAAAVHRRVATTNDDDAAADLFHVLEGDRGQPVDADMNVLGRLLAAGDLEILALGGTSAHEHGVIAFIEHRLHALDLVAEAGLDAEMQDALDLLIEHGRRQAE